MMECSILCMLAWCYHPTFRQCQSDRLVGASNLSTHFKKGCKFLISTGLLIDNGQGTIEVLNVKRVNFQIGTLRDTLWGALKHVCYGNSARTVSRKMSPIRPVEGSQVGSCSRSSSLASKLLLRLYMTWKVFGMILSNTLRAIISRSVPMAASSGSTKI